jgi:uncharacterized membrane protein HdeD (DUF308 family)
MLQVMARNWWALAIRGVAAILFGILVFIVPGIALQSLILLFAAYAIVDGIFAIITAVRDRAANNRWWVLLLEGIVSIIAGIFAFLQPAMTALVLLYLIAAWAIVTGVFEIIAAIRLREEIEGELLLGLAGLASLLFGIFLIVSNPATGILAVLWMVGVYSIAFGVLMLILAFRLRGMANRTPTDQQTRAHA